MVKVQGRNWEEMKNVQESSMHNEFLFSNSIY